MEDRVERTEKGLHLVPVVHSPFAASDQGSYQFKKLIEASIEENGFFHYHIFLPDGMFEQSVQVVTLFHHSVQPFFQLHTFILQVLCHLTKLGSV